MSTHIEAKKGEIADTVLLPGDPMRAKWIAETFLDNAICYNDVRGMLAILETIKVNLYLYKELAWEYHLHLSTVMN